KSSSRAPWGSANGIATAARARKPAASTSERSRSSSPVPSNFVSLEELDGSLRRFVSRRTCSRRPSWAWSAAGHSTSGSSDQTQHRNIGGLRALSVPDKKGGVIPGRGRERRAFSPRAGGPGKKLIADSFQGKTVVSYKACRVAQSFLR